VIVVDTSAIFAVLYKEPQAAICHAALRSEPTLVISAGTLSEAQVVAARSGFLAVLESFLENMQFEIVDVTAETAAAVGPAYARWGKGFHPAKLNFGDTFAYVLAKQRACPLLFIGNDFSLTDVTPALR